MDCVGPLGAFLGQLHRGRWIVGSIQAKLVLSPTHGLQRPGQRAVAKPHGSRPQAASSPSPTRLAMHRGPQRRCCAESRRPEAQLPGRSRGSTHCRLACCFRQVSSRTCLHRGILCPTDHGGVGGIAAAFSVAMAVRLLPRCSQWSRPMLATAITGGRDAPWWRPAVPPGPLPAPTGRRRAAETPRRLRSRAVQRV